MKFYRPQNLLAGFHAYQIDTTVPELLQVGEQWASKEPIILRPQDYWLFLPISGESRWEVLGQTYTVQPGNCLILLPQVLYRMRDRTSVKHHYFFATLNMSLVLERLSELKPLWQNHSLVFIENGESLMLPFRQLIREVSLELPYRGLGLRLALDYLILETSRLIEKQLNEEPPEASLVLIHPTVARVKDLLEAQPNYQWRLEELARQAGISVQHLTKCFTRDIGVSPHQYLMQVRVNRAKQLLSQSDIAITELALELGFSSSQHFATVYKKLTGETAQRYRNSVRQFAISS